MAGGTGIEWTDETWNPVTGCSRVSPGCDNCYMFSLYPRLNAMGVRGYETAPDDVRLIRERLDRPLRWQRPRRVFVNSMSDLFHREVPYSFISEVFDTMRQAERHVFQVLTKRPGRAVGWWRRSGFDEWPSNVWIGVSVENQKYAPRVDVLSRLPAPVRFVSAEPLVGALELGERRMDAIEWLIVGGESGRDARPMDETWARALRDEATGAGVAFFLKQLGGSPDKRGGDKATLDGKRWTQWPETVR